MVSAAIIQLCCCAKQPQITYNERVWLCFNKTLFLNAEILVSYNVPHATIKYSFDFPPYHLKMQKSFLGHGPTKEKQDLAQGL